MVRRIVALARRGVVVMRVVRRDPATTATAACVITRLVPGVGVDDPDDLVNRAYTVENGRVREPEIPIFVIWILVSERDRCRGLSKDDHVHEEWAGRGQRVEAGRA